MDDAKRTYREAENETKEQARRSDGDESLSDKAANIGRRHPHRARRTPATRSTSRSTAPSSARSMARTSDRRKPSATRPRPSAGASSCPRVDRRRARAPAVAAAVRPRSPRPGPPRSAAWSCSSATSTRAPAEAAVEIGLEDRRVDVAPPCDRRRIAEPLGRQAHRLDDVAFRAGAPWSSRLERRRARYASSVPGPRPEVLRREVAAGDLPQVVVDVVGRDVADDSPSSSTYWKSSCPGSSWHAPDDSTRDVGPASRPRARSRPCRGTGTGPPNR